MAEERSQWVLIQSCGCVTGVLEGSYADTWLQAAVEFYDDCDPSLAETGADRLLSDIESGVRIRRIPHEEYVEKYLHHMSMDYNCPHATDQKPGFWRQFWSQVWYLVLRKGRRSHTW